MGADDVVAVIESLERNDVDAWLDGGWGIDALVGRESRLHEDLDLVVPQDDLPRAQAALADLGFEHDPSVEPGLPARLVLVAPGGLHVDLHPVVLDEHGNGWHPLGEDAYGLYPAEGLKGDLLIAHGMVDVNVHFQDVVRLTQRLIELGKADWELAVYPVEDHAFVRPSSWTDEYRRIFELFERVLRPSEIRSSQ
jgi:hypothetical protein